MRIPALLSAIVLAVGCSGKQAKVEDPVFTIAAIPDPQNYVSYDHQKATGYPFDSVDQWLEQMRYVADHLESAGGDIAFVTVLGDNWNHASIPIDPDHERRGFERIPNPETDARNGPAEQTRSYEMPMAGNGVELLAGKVPLSIVPGNHDYDAQWTPSRFPGQSHFGGLTNFVSVYGADSPFFKDKPWYVASNDGGADSAQVFAAGGYRFLHIGLQFSPPDRSLAWAASVIARYPGLPTIVSTHDHLNPKGEQLAHPHVDEELVDPEDDNGPASVWKKLLSKQDSIFLVLSGHEPGQSRRVDRNDFGHDVHQILADYQTRLQTALDVGFRPDPPVGIGDGWLRLLTFDMSAATPTIQVKTYSTHYQKLSSEMPDYAKWYRPQEQPDMTDAEFLAAEEFTISLTDFRERFDRTAKVAR
jgi:calcineurin-like phosphoesterase family protein